jgi:hypothetical protein
MHFIYQPVLEDGNHFVKLMDTISRGSMAQALFTLFNDSRLHKIKWTKMSLKFKVECMAEFKVEYTGINSFRNYSWTNGLALLFVFKKCVLHA